MPNEKKCPKCNGKMHHNRDAWNCNDCGHGEYMQSWDELYEENAALKSEREERKKKLQDQYNETIKCSNEYNKLLDGWSIQRKEIEQLKERIKQEKLKSGKFAKKSLDRGNEIESLKAQLQECKKELSEEWKGVEGKD